MHNCFWFSFPVFISTAIADYAGCCAVTARLYLVANAAARWGAVTGTETRMICARTGTCKIKWH